MTKNVGARPPVWFWIIAILSTLWSLAGCFAYYTQVSMSSADLAKLPALQQEIWKMMPAWATAAYAVAVWIGLGGSISLLLRRRWARPLFLISLLGIIVQFGWTFLGTPILDRMGAADSVPFPAVIFIIGLFLVWFSARAARRGWLR
jgi:hypothetical protein